MGRWGEYVFSWQVGRNRVFPPEHSAVQEAVKPRDSELVFAETVLAGRTTLETIPSCKDRQKEPNGEITKSALLMETQ